MAFLPQRPRRPLPARRDDRGVAFPSPVVMLSVVAVAMAGIAFVATGDEEPAEREITVASREPASEPATPEPTTTPSKKPLEPKKKKKPKPEVVRGEVYVVVFNNSGITGLAAEVSGAASGAGWQVVGADNWYGTIPASTVYYPPKLEDAAKLLALDLGIRRVQPSVEPMNFDRLTVILTADAA